MSRRDAPRGFALKLAEWTTQVERRCAALVQGVAMSVFDNVQSGGKYSPGTPIESGNARGAWSAQVGRLAPVPRAGWMAPASARMLALQEISSAQAGDPVFIANTAPHILRLEFRAWSDQAPQGFVRLTIAAAPTLVREVADRVAAGNLKVT